MLKELFYYSHNWFLGKKDKVYPPQYWGEFPLYSLACLPKVLVKITNLGPSAKTKEVIKTESYVLKTNGTNGAMLKPPETIEVEIEKGETKVIDATYLPLYEHLKPTPDLTDL